jgi:glycosyltransferase involved in cell wall biosynthesis
MTPQISIIIPCYNQGQYVLDAISSVEQYPDKSVYEIIIINDGSTDENSIAVLKSLEEKGYHVINQNNQGLSMARNSGIALSKGKYILLLDQDNKIRPAYIDKGIQILDSHPEVGIVYGNSLHFGDVNKIYKTGVFNIKKLLYENYIDACIVMRKKVWEETGGYDKMVSAYCDWDINLCAYELGWKFQYVNEILFEYRVRKDSMLRQLTNSGELTNYIARKHGILYRTEFLKTLTIRRKLKSALIDLCKKIIGKPVY